MLNLFMIKKYLIVFSVFGDVIFMIFIRRYKIDCVNNFV